MSDLHARDPEKTSLHVSSMFSTSHSECHSNASPRKVLAHCGFFGQCFHARISQIWSASCRIQLKHWTTPMLQPCLRDSGMKNINQKIHKVLKHFLVKHCHDTLNGWLKTLRKHGVMVSLGSGMNITHTFSILWPCFHQKNSKHQEMFCHWMLENIDQNISYVNTMF